MEKTQIRPNQSSFPSYDVHFRLKNLQIAVMNFENFLTIDDLVSYCRQLTSERIVVQHHGVKRVAFAEFREAEILCIKNRDTQNIVWPPNKNSNKLPLPHKPLPIPSPSFKSIGAALTNEVFADKLQGIEIPEQPPKKPLGGPVYVPPSKRIVVPPTPVPAPIITAPSVTTLQKNIPTSDRLIEIPKSTLPSRPKPILEIREEDFFPSIKEDKKEREISTGGFLSVNPLPAEEKLAPKTLPEPIPTFNSPFADLDILEKEIQNLENDSSYTPKINTETDISTKTSKTPLKTYIVRVLDKNQNIQTLTVQDYKWKNIFDTFTSKVNEGLYEDLIDIYLNKYVFTNSAVKNQLLEEGKINK